MTIEPAPEHWPRLIEDFVRARWQFALNFREQAGLPTDRPIVMTGHQPFFWHPGVLAKFIACDAAGAIAAPAWIVPDQDEVDPAHVRAPVLDAKGILHARLLAYGPPPQPGTPTASLPAFDPDPVAGVEFASASVARGVERIGRALATHEEAPTLARQSQGGLTDLLKDWVAPAPTVYASELSKTDLFMDLVRRMIDGPEEMVSIYNAAVQRHPNAGVLKLIANPVQDRWELPLWRLRPGEPRRRVYAEQVESIPREELAPRALFMTAMLRLAGCDLFIHGVGGGAYDEVMEDWITEWLGKPVAPKVVVTATVTIPLRERVPTDEEAQQAAWRAHSARHNPALVGDQGLEQEKMALVHSIAQGGVDRAALFRRMHELLATFRAQQNGALEALDSEAERLRLAAGERGIVNDRTWAFPLHERESLEALKEEMHALFAPVGSGGAA